MKFGWINAFGALVVTLMLIPNIVYALKNKGEKNLCNNRFMNIIEQVGRYACIVLMWLPLMIQEFGFSSVSGMLIYFAGNICLLAAYWIIFACYMKEKNAKRTMALAALPAVIFVMSGLLLRHLLLVIFSALFAVGHIYVTVKNQAAMQKQ
ncbi:MAG: hypothetical protein K6B52_05145 [Clostridiales bacterium]|nr:hypothetical protein [Clostridiales bacterium]